MIYRAIIYVLFIKANTHGRQGGRASWPGGNTLWMAISCVRQEAPVVVAVVALGPGSVVVLAQLQLCSD